MLCGVYRLSNVSYFSQNYIIKVRAEWLGICDFNQLDSTVLVLRYVGRQHEPVVSMLRLNLM